MKGSLPLWQFAASILELHQLIIDVFNVHVSPRNIVVTANSVDNVVVQFVQFLQQVKFLFDLRQFRIVSLGQSKQFLPILKQLQSTPHPVEAILLKEINSKVPLKKIYLIT